MRKNIVLQLMVAIVFFLAVCSPTKAIERELVKNFATQIEKTASGIVSSYTILLPKTANPQTNADYKIVTVQRVDEKYYQKGRIHIKTKTKFDNGKEHLLQNSTYLNNTLNKIGANVSKVFADYKQIEKYPEMKSVGFDRLYEIEIPADADPINICAELMQNPDVEYACPIYVRFPNYSPNDPKKNQQYAISNMKLAQAWDITKGDPEITIAIVDSGTDWVHSDLAANIWSNPNETLNGVDDDDNGKIDDIRGWDFCATTNLSQFLQGDFGDDNNPTNTVNTHGTSVAGCASAVTDNSIGVASPGFNCKIIPVKMGSELQGYEGIYRAYEGITYAANLGAKIINCSWGGIGYSPAEEQVINYAIKTKGCFVVVASGNDGTNNDEFPNYPCNYPGVFSVGATSSSNAMTNFSNYGYTVHSFAPGSSVYTTDASNQYTTIDGTSFSSPYTAGVAGLVLSVAKKYDQTWTPKKLFHQLRSTSDRNIMINNQLVDQVYGSINAYKAVTYNFPGGPTVPGISILGYTIDGTATNINNHNSHTFSATVKNYLGTASNLKISAFSTDAFLECSTTPIQVNTLNTDATQEISISIKINEKCPWFSGYATLIIKYEADDYSDYEFIKIPINLPTTNTYTQITQLPLTTSWNAISVPNANTCWAVGSGPMFNNYTGIIQSYNGSLITKSINTNVPAYAIYGIDRYNAFVGTSYSNQSRVYKTSNAGNNWTSVLVSSFTDFINDLHFFDASNGIMLGDPKNSKWGVAYTQNGGTQWTLSNIPLPNTSESGLVGAYTAIGETVWFGTSSGRTFRSTDKGHNWNAIGQLSGIIHKYAFQNANYGIAIYETSSNILGLAITRDGGETWTNKIENLALSGIYPVTAFAVEKAKAFYLVDKQGAIFKTIDEGATWTMERTKRDNLTLRADVYNNTSTNTVTMYDIGADLGKLQFQYYAPDAKAAISFINGTEYKFDTTEVNKTITKLIKITNNGEITANISSSYISPLGSTTPNEFVLNTNPTTLSTGSTQSLSVTFAPSTIGEKSARLVLHYNGSPDTSFIVLRGYSKEKSIEPTYILDLLSKDTLDFDTLNLNAKSTKVIAMKNNGNQAITLNTNLTLSENTSANEFTVENSSTPMIIEPNAELSINAEFTPISIGNKSATLEITYSGQVSPIRVQLLGVGKDEPNSVEEIYSMHATSVRPNPAKDYIEIYSDNSLSDISAINIYNQNGELILTNIPKEIFAKNLILNTSSFSGGSYQMVIDRNGIKEAINIIIVK